MKPVESHPSSGHDTVGAQGPANEPNTNDEFDGQDQYSRQDPAVAARVTEDLSQANVEFPPSEAYGEAGGPIPSIPDDAAHGT